MTALIAHIELHVISYTIHAREKRSARIREDRRTPRKSAIYRETTRIIIACDSRKMLNMRFYTVIFAYFRGVYTRTRGIPRGFLPLTARSLAQYPRNFADLSSRVYNMFILYVYTTCTLILYNSSGSNQYTRAPVGLLV